MANLVVVTGIHRANLKVEPMEIHQMVGRAGRPKIENGKVILSRGDAYVLLPEQEFNDLKDEFSQVKPVVSRLCDPRTLAFHIVSEVAQGRIIDASSFSDWYERSLAHAQGRIIERFQIEEVFEKLCKLRAIEPAADGETYSATNLGKISYHMYFSPYMVCGWYFNFARLFKEGVELDRVPLAWALSNVRDYAEGVIGAGVNADEVKKFKSDCSALGLKIDKGPAVVGTAYGGMMQNTPMPGLAALQGQLRTDIDRVVTALTMIEQMCASHWKYKRWSSVGARIRYGVPAKMLPLVQIEGVGGKRASSIWACGIRTPSELVSRTELHDRLRGRLGLKTFDTVLKAAAKHIRDL